MKTYTIYADQKGAYHVIKQGWSWPAFFFTWIWAFSKKRWIWGLLALVPFILTWLVLGMVQEKDLNTLVVLMGNSPVFAALAFFGLNGNEWIENSYRKKGYKYIFTTLAASPRDALDEYHKMHPEKTTEEVPETTPDFHREIDKAFSTSEQAEYREDHFPESFLPGLRPLGNRERLTHTDNQYDARIFLFSDKEACMFYYDLFVLNTLSFPPPFCVEVMVVKIHTIYEEPYGFIFPHGGTDTRPDYQNWIRELTLKCNEADKQYQPFTHSYEQLHQYVKKVYQWEILTPDPFDYASTEAQKILSDPPDGGYPALNGEKHSPLPLPAGNESTDDEPDKSLVDMSMFIEELMNIGVNPGYLVTEPAEGFNDDYRNIRAREIGQILFDQGGREMMQNVANEVKTIHGAVKARELEYAWNQVGTWYA